MRFVATRVVAVLAMVAGITLAQAVPAVAMTPEARAALRDRLVQLATAGSSPVADPAINDLVVWVANPASRGLNAAARHRRARRAGAAPAQKSAILVGGLEMDSRDGFQPITVAHCLAGAQSRRRGVGRGMVESATFLGPDLGLLQIGGLSPSTPQSEVAFHAGSARVTAMADLAVETSVRKTGRTRETTCGTELAKSAARHFRRGVVYGPIDTEICAGVDDSGAPLLSARGGYGSRSKCGVFGILYGSPDLACEQRGHRSAFQPLPPLTNYFRPQPPAG